MVQGINRRNWARDRVDIPDREGFWCHLRDKLTINAEIGLLSRQAHERGHIFFFFSPRLCRLAMSV